MLMRVPSTPIHSSLSHHRYLKRLCQIHFISCASQLAAAAVRRHSPQCVGLHRATRLTLSRRTEDERLMNYD